MSEEENLPQGDAAPGGDAAGGEQMPDDWGAAMQEQGDGEGGGEDADADAWAAALAAQEGDDVPGEGGGEVNLDHILEVPLTISMEIGRSRISIRNLLQLNQGSVVELDRLAGEPMDVLVNGTLIAHGEVVVVNDKFGIRLTDVVSAVERIKQLA